MTDGALHHSESISKDDAETVHMNVDLELEVDGEISTQQLTSLVMDAVEADERVAIEFACTTISEE